MDKQSEATILTLAIYVGLPVLLIGVGWLIGGISESSHESALRKREEELQYIEVTSMRTPPGFSASNSPCVLVSGEAVIASDAFKSWIFALKNIVGGESKTYSRLFERARREALLRMKEQARGLGFDAICNLRYDCADIGGNASAPKGKRGANMAVAIVSGTAWCRKGN
ncbi:MAG: heavy metal-binding domain-containing protein [Kiritimatiellae bacterium]|nr:heavy metal-binding domain-containing protein [Kiritimatiellia bacterium]